MKTRVKELVSQAEKTFARRSNILSLWQDIAENFYPERADFTSLHQIGEDYASHLMSGYPSMCRRDLANTLSGMLRPRGKPWFKTQMLDDRLNEEPRIRQATEWFDTRMRRRMYEQRAQFMRATKEGDHDFSAFGQCVIEARENLDKTGLLYLAFHLRDVAWCENAERAVDKVYLKWRPSARQLLSQFPKTSDAKVHDMVRDNPDEEVCCYRIVMPADDYDSYGVSEEDKRKGPRNGPLVSIYVDKDNDKILEEVRLWENPFVIPRWHTLGSSYAISPATTIALPDSRLLQRMALTLLEAGEKAVDPPVVATSEVLRSDVQLFAGGITMVDRDYDERNGGALRPLDQDYRGLQFGLEMLQDVREQITAAFYLNKINLPPVGDDMTATEVQERVSEYVRQALPLFEPMETEYNGALCEKTFNIMLRGGYFGSLEGLPRELQGQDIKFVFDSPLQAATERAKAISFKESAELLAMAAQIDPGAVDYVNVGRALKDALRGVQAPATWIRSDEEVQQAAEDREAVQQAAGTAQAVSAGATVAGQVGQAAQQLQAAGIT